MCQATLLIVGWLRYIPEQALGGRMQNLGVLFDWDGVIIDSSNLHERSWEVLAKRLGLNLPEGFFLKSFGQRNQTIIPDVLGWASDAQEIDKLAFLKEEIYRELMHNSSLDLLPGVRELVLELQEKGIPYCIASSTPRANIEAVLRKTQCQSMFPHIVASEDVRHGKPHPEVFLQAAKKIKLEPSHCVVIEDAMVGIEAAIRAGIARIAVSKTHDKNFFKHTHLILPSMQDIRLSQIEAVSKEHVAAQTLFSSLTKADALSRRSLLKGDVLVFADLVVEEEGKFVSGSFVMEWEQLKAGSLWLDYRGRELGKVRLNQEDILPDWKGKARILLPETEAGRHRIEIQFKRDSSESGMGLTLVQRGEDRFLYTNFVPMEACSLFPCFDQPDIKARFNLKLTCDKSWEVCSNSLIQKTVTNGDSCTHEFAKTRPLSSYLWHFSAGNFLTLEYLGESKVPMRLFFRREKLPFVDSDKLFSMMDQGILWYQKYFGIPFPYQKYDQIFLPGFYWGGMENAACVVLREEILFENSPSEDQLFDRGNLLLHELSHMWFGDLVTMKWWDDLWLNEAFATWVSYRAQKECGGFQNANLVFMEDVLHKALKEDDLSTTHPVVQDCPDTEQAFLNFDAITYQKGASLIAQICDHLGEERFCRGLNLYMNRHQDDNANLSDFLNAFSEPELLRFSDQWLLSTGYPKLKYHIDGSLSIDEGAGSREFLRIAKEVFPVQGHRVGFDRSLKTVTGLAFFNLGQNGYARIYPSQEFFAYLTDSIEDCKDEEIRLGLVQHLFNGVWLKECRVSQFVGFAQKLLLVDDYSLFVAVRRLEDVLKYRSDLLNQSEIRSFADRVYAISQKSKKTAFSLLVGASLLQKDFAGIKKLYGDNQRTTEEMRLLEQALVLGDGSPITLAKRSDSEEERLHNLRLDLSRLCLADPEKTIMDLMLLCRIGDTELDYASFGRVCNAYFMAAPEAMVDRYFELLSQILAKPVDMVFKTHLLNSLFPWRYQESSLKGLSRLLQADLSQADRRTLCRSESILKLWGGLI